MRLMMLAAVLAALAGCNRGQSASAQVLQRDAGRSLTPSFTIDAGKLQLTTPGRDAGMMQLVPPAGQPPGTVPNPFPTGGGTIPR